MEFDGKVVAVTGAGSGVGRAVAESFAAEGARVAIIDIDLERAQETAEKIQRDGGTALAVRCNVGKREDVNRAAAEVAEAFSPIEILISNAGNIAPAMIRKMTDEQWRSVMAVHLDASFYWLQAVLEDMITAGGGRIIFTASSAAVDGSIGQVNYSAAKSGMLGLVRTAARELGRYGILVNAVLPAALTPMSAPGIEANRGGFDPSKAPLRRLLGEPSEMAGAYLFLAGDRSSFMTGQILNVDGGQTFLR